MLFLTAFQWSVFSWLPFLKSKVQKWQKTNEEVTHSFIGILFKTGDFCKGSGKTESKYGIEKVHSFQGFSKTGCVSKFSS